ncbi:MAG: diphosphate--fructose-6-phosphate 1-phosphotransferase [Spirochaetia bacterium]|jgi:pyrophosphate--fructose-6-phosphate 1-phosphotransferase|nr:diphosphate--fructose-6-phosphate 1-phosphotransferase [Spirochaetia bacterium]
MLYSPLQTERYKYEPKLPEVLKGDIHKIGINPKGSTKSETDQKELTELFPRTYGAPFIETVTLQEGIESESINIGVVLSGGQAPGGHNVISGLYDAMKKANPDSKLIGFLGGPSGILDNKSIELSAEIVDQYRNTGGFDIIGSGRTKLESTEQFDICEDVCKLLDISSIVIVGGDDSNTNGAVLAEYFKQKNSGISVIGVPKTIDGDLKNEYIEVSFGFDTATKTYSELIGNIEKDANSAKKYWHFIKLMGRSASHICLECALQTHPNIALISEEIEHNHKSLTDIVMDMVSIIAKRSEMGSNYGIVLIPEGLIEFIPEMKQLISELNTLLADHTDHFETLHTFEDQSRWINRELSRDSSYVFSTLPNNIQRQLLVDRDPHGNVQVSRIDTEKLLIQMVASILDEMESEGKFKGTFSPQDHFFGYEGRCAFPSNFDTDYCYSLGFNAYILAASGLTGYLSSIRNLSKPVGKWTAGGVPITMMMNLEQRHGKMKPVIKKAMVDLNGKPFAEFASKRDSWGIKSTYMFPGAIQYFGPSEVCDATSMTLQLEGNNIENV